MKKNKTVIAVAVNSLFAQESTNFNEIESLSIKSGPINANVTSVESNVIKKPFAEREFSSEEQKLNWNITDIKQKVSEFSSKGKLSQDLLDVLCKNGSFAPVEFECLDYKERIEKTPYAKAKLVQQVVSFYNTFGGYLIFGVVETEAEIRFDIVGISPSEIDVESLKASIKEFTGERISVTLMNLETLDANNTLASVAILYIPKRPLAIPPLHFLKNGPGNDQKKPIFYKDEVYSRRGDECVEAKGPRILELNGDRPNPHLSEGGGALTARLRVNRIPHNLPDRNFICPEFIGRDKYVDALWRWLGDDLSHVKVLAGEGGLGKSSIAFEFAERVSEARNAPFEQLIWLTAKEQQFNAFEDK